MDKNLKLYIGTWAVMLVLFNIIALAIPGPGRFSASFWIGYVGVTLALVGILVCAFLAFKAENRQKLFYSFSLIRISWTWLILAFIFGGLCMLLPSVPYWVALVVCAIILAIDVISLLNAKIAVNAVSAVDEKVKSQTFFIRSLTADAQTLMSGAKSVETKEICKKVYESVRFSDPMSDEALSGVEGQIEARFSEFSQAVAKDDAEEVKSVADELLLLLEQRNNKCRLLK